MATTSRGDENDPFAKPAERKSWNGTAQPPPPGPPLPPGSPIASPPAAVPGITMYPPPPPSSSWGASSSKNWMGVTSLVLGVSLCGAGILGVVFGHMGLAACRRGEATNRGLALAGVIVNYSLIGLGVLGFAIAAATGGDDRSATPTHTSGFASQTAAPSHSVEPTPDAAASHPLDTSLAISRYWYDLIIGDCVTSFHAAEPDANGDHPYVDPVVVPCSEPHYGEVYALALIGGTGAPGDAVFRAHVEQLCEGSAFSDYVGVSDYYASALYDDVLYPNAEAWKEGGREMVCLVIDESGTNVGSVRDSGL